MSSSNKRTISEVEVESVQESPSLAIGSFFKGVNVPEDTTFELYRKHVKSSNAKDSFILHGENERLEYEGMTDDIVSNSTQSVIGIFNKSKNTIQLYKAPIISSKVIAKSSKNLRGPVIKHSDSRGLRNALGEAFGTKKAKKAIADMERNRIDSDKLTESAIDIVDSVRTAAKDLPTREQLQSTVSNDRPTPMANLDATDVEQIYPVENIIPTKELQFIRVGNIFKAEDLDTKLELLPYETKSKYVAKKLGVFTQPNQLVKLQLLYYLNLLMGVYENRRVNSKVKLMERLNSPPEILIDGILNRFTVARPGQMGKSKERSFFIDPQHEDKLVCYILTLVFHLDNFIVEISPLAQELSIKPSKIVSLFRTLGAIVKGATVAQAEAFGVPKSAANTYKIATLKVPFKLPEMTRRGRAQRR
ncbi:DNA-directed RNA polymerase I subunit RPA49 NDAI_0F03990 [Naumovozyma dairenensis CBS 421]|uniref:DNA-directed RNA polymerase I subunit RPA49 n=1 Tax=Naumovozyma dairenensis (strain ATCC 10597 / BCRC 20456 / CBS 421 / NBRC 0211 / NRRL Y-12639) TaxID=1071378 RepID=G0WD56_NAUDC|nr:hypothetical protein NDAI_0F03990 [Naumovozyma dairenensis CBS 421]CCD25717.1 hypothetical protein NDAI_0F03990 [Naumovozyma dairenensis CBS 421]